MISALSVCVVSAASITIPGNGGDQFGNGQGMVQHGTACGVNKVFAVYIYIFMHETLHFVQKKQDVFDSEIES